MGQRLSYCNPLLWVLIHAVRGQSVLFAEAGIAEPTQSDLDQHVLQPKTRTVRNGPSQPISQGGDAPGVQEAQSETLLNQLDQFLTAGEHLHHYLKTSSVRLRVVGCVGEPTSNELHDLTHWEKREGSKRKMVSGNANLLRKHGEYYRIKLRSRPLIHC